MIKLFATDVDGVLTDGKAYIYQGSEIKSVCYQDLDTFGDIRRDGIQIAVITGEDNEFTNYIKQKIKPDYFYSGCKDKAVAMLELIQKSGVDKTEVCYIGDGKYDTGAMENVGISMCPSNAIESVKRTASTVLDRRGGDGCIGEAYYILKNNIG
jgi:3-deoxy-D-manno-octulosonate 8-phosphate phosphatase (KDO 8-P phosphatase)